MGSLSEDSSEPFINATHTAVGAESPPQNVIHSGKLEPAQRELDPESSGFIPTRIYRETVLVTTAVFMGYASLVVMQEPLYKQWNSNFPGNQKNSAPKNLFKHGTSLVYVGNLIFRLLHNFVLGYWLPRTRVVISLFCVAFSMSLIVFFYFITKSTSVIWVFVAYLFGGVGIGSFEANLLSTITPLGHDTKFWAIFGMPLGFTLVSVVGYALMDVGLPLVCIYIFVAISCVCAFGIWTFVIPTPRSFNKQTFTMFLSNMQSSHEWFPKIGAFALALMFDMFCVSFFSAINQYIWCDKILHLFGSYSGAPRVTIDRNAFFSIYSVATFLGDSGGRKIVYALPWVLHPGWYILFSVVGAGCCLVRIPFLTWIGMFLIFLANGLIYGSSTRKIDDVVDKTFNLTALSVWLFVGDIGSVTGSNTWEFIKIGRSSAC